MTTPSEGSRPNRRGRPPSTTQARIERVAIDLFQAQGFDDTTVDDIARAAGIGRRTFFRYFRSKNDVPWGDFEAHLSRMRALFVALPADLPLMEELRRIVLAFNEVDAAEEPWLRRRMQLILTVPALQAHSMLKYRQWRQVVAEHAARRLGQSPDDLLPRAVGWAALGISVSAYEQWLAEPDSSLADLLDQAYQALAVGFRPDLPAGAGTGRAS